MSVYIGVAIVTVSYLMVNISYFAVLSLQEITFAIAVALVSGRVWKKSTCNAFPNFLLIGKILQTTKLTHAQTHPH